MIHRTKGENAAGGSAWCVSEPLKEGAGVTRKHERGRQVSKRGESSTVSPPRSTTTTTAYQVCEQ